MTPREKFQRDKQAVKSHAAMADDSFVEATFEVALAEMLWRQGDVPMPEGIRQNDKLQGAKAFIEIWRSLSTKTTATPKADDSGRLIPEEEEDESNPYKFKK